MKEGKYDYLKPLCRARTPRKVRRLCKKMSDGQLQRMVDLTLGIMRKRVPVKPQGVAIIMANRKALRHFVNPSYSLKSKRRYLIQKGGSIGSVLGKILRVAGSGLKQVPRTFGRAAMTGLSSVGKTIAKTPLGKTVTGKMAQGYKRFGVKPSWGSVGRPAWRYIIKPAAKYAFRKGVREPFQRKFVQPMRRNWNALRMRAEESGRAVKYRVQGLTKSGRERVRLDRQKFEDAAMDEFVDLKRSGLTQHKPQGAIDRLKFRRNYETLQRAEKRAEAHLKNPDSFDSGWWVTKKLKNLFRGKRSVSAPAATQRSVPGVESNLTRGQMVGDAMDFAYSQATDTRPNAPSRVGLPQSWNFWEKFRKWKNVPAPPSAAMSKVGSVKYQPAKAASRASSKSGSYHTAVGEEYTQLVHPPPKPPRLFTAAPPKPARLFTAAPPKPPSVVKESMQAARVRPVGYRYPESASGGKRQLRWPKKPPRSARLAPKDDEPQFWNPPKHAGPWGPQMRLPGGSRKVPLERSTRMTRGAAKQSSTPEFAQLQPPQRSARHGTVSTRVGDDMPRSSRPRPGENVPPPPTPRKAASRSPSIVSTVSTPKNAPQIFPQYGQPPILPKKVPRIKTPRYEDIRIQAREEAISAGRPKLMPYDLSDVSTLGSKFSRVGRRSNDPLPPLPGARRNYAFSSSSSSSKDTGHYPAEYGAIDYSRIPSAYRSNLSNVQRFIDQSAIPIRRRAHSMGVGMNPRRGFVNVGTQYEAPRLSFGQKFRKYAKNTGVNIAKSIPSTIITGAIGAATTYGVMEAMGYGKGGAVTQPQTTTTLPTEYSRSATPRSSDYTRTPRKVRFAEEDPWSAPSAGERTNKRAKYDDDVPYLREHNPAATTTHWWD